MIFSQSQHSFRIAICTLFCLVCIGFQAGQPMYQGNATTLTLGSIVLTNPKIVYPVGKGLVVPTLLGLDFLSN